MYYHTGDIECPLFFAPHSQTFINFDSSPFQSSHATKQTYYSTLHNQLHKYDKRYVIYCTVQYSTVSALYYWSNVWLA